MLQLAPHLRRSSGIDEDKRFAFSQMLHPGEAEGSSGIEAGNATEIEEDKTGLRQLRIFDPPANTFQQIVGRAKEAEALKF